MSKALKNKVKLNDVVSVKDYGAKGDGVTDDTAAIVAAFAASSVVYAPKGVYIFNAAITLPSQFRLYGDGMDRTVFRATNAAARFTRAATRHDNIILENFTLDGNNLSTKGIVLGVKGSLGTLALSSSDRIINVKVAQCTDMGIELQCMQYCELRGVIVSTITNGYGMYVSDSSLIDFYNLLATSCKTAVYCGGDSGGTNPGGFSQSADIQFYSLAAYGPYSGAAEGYLVLDNAYNVAFYSLYLEHEIAHSQPLIRILRSSNSVTSNITFEGANFVGLPFTTDLVRVDYGRRIKFSNCNAFAPTAGNYIIKVTDGNATVELENCYVNTSYSTFATIRWMDSAGYYSVVTATNLVDGSYQQGTCDLTLTDLTNNATMNAKTCTWVKVGRMVTLTGDVSTTSVASLSGNLYLTGLPFNVAQFGGSSIAYATGLVLTAGQSVALLATPAAPTRLQLRVWNAAAGTSALNNAQWSATGGVVFSVVYMAAN